MTIWGFGSIGRTLEPHLTALGATVTGAARHARQEGHVTVIDEAHLLDQLAQTDVLIMILPSTPATRGALDADKLAALPAHAWVVNVGRGERGRRTGADGRTAHAAGSPARRWTSPASSRCRRTPRCGTHRT